MALSIIKKPSRIGNSKGFVIPKEDLCLEMDKRYVIFIVEECFIVNRSKE